MSNLSSRLSRTTRWKIHRSARQRQTGGHVPVLTILANQRTLKQIGYPMGRLRAWPRTIAPQVACGDLGEALQVSSYRSSNSGQSPVARPNTIAVPHFEGIKLVRVDSIDWIEAARHYIRIHCDGEQHLVRARISDVARWLGHSDFFQVNRSAVVRLDRVATILRCGRDDFQIRLMSGVYLRIGRKYRRLLLKRLGPP
jgi:DNA-binding LytR/AlgR family response regulator